MEGIGYYVNMATSMQVDFLIMIYEPFNDVQEEGILMFKCQKYLISLYMFCIYCL